MPPTVPSGVTDGLILAGNTERMLKALFGALGFEHVKVVFEGPPRA